MLALRKVHGNLTTVDSFATGDCGSGDALGSQAYSSPITTDYSQSTLARTRCRYSVLATTAASLSAMSSRQVVFGPSA